MLDQLTRKATTVPGHEARVPGIRHMEMMHQTMSGIAHDLNNVLMIVSGNVELLRHEIRSEKSERLLNAIERMAHRGKSLSAQLLSFAPARMVKPSVVDVGLVLQELCHALKHCLRRDIEISIAVPDSACFAKVDRGELELAALNLVVNARDAMPEGGTFSVSVTSEFEEEKMNGRGRRELIVLRFSDTGSGIPAHLISRVFEPFFTTKQLEKGTGLGLSQVSEFAQQARGHVSVASVPGRGTTFTICLPRV
jgi:two-component system NtrC family sensor kinase